MVALALAVAVGAPAAVRAQAPPSPRSAAAAGAVDSTSPSVTLRQALERARTARPLAALAAAGVDRARGSARLATQIPNPQLSAQFDERTPTRQTVATQPLGWLVRRGPDAAAGRAVLARATADSAQLLADLGRDVSRAFYGALAASERLRLTTEQALLADSLVTLADRRVSAGDISALERDQVAQEASRARLVAAQARELAQVAGVELARAVAWDQGALPRPAGALADGLEPTAPGASPGGLPGAGTPTGVPVELASLPSLRAALADSAAAAARLRSARLAQLPVPSLVAGMEWGTSSDPLLGSTTATRQTPILGLAVPLPLFNRGGEAVAEARGVAAEGAARAAEARLTAGAQVEAARIRVAETASRARFARDSLFTEATRIRAGAVRLYDSGRTGLLPVIDALRTEREVAQALVQELLAFQEARADLAALLGQWP